MAVPKRKTSKSKRDSRRSQKKTAVGHDRESKTGALEIQKRRTDHEDDPPPLM